MLSWEILKFSIVFTQQNENLRNFPDGIVWTVVSADGSTQIIFMKPTTENFETFDIDNYVCD